MHRSRLPQLLFICLATAFAAASLPLPALAQTLHIHPAQITLSGPESSDQITVLLNHPDGSSRDITRSARLVLSDPTLATVSPSGRIEPLRDGQLLLTAEADGLTAKAAITIANTSTPPPVSFRHDILPLLTRASCNSGGCHGKAEGQNGFKLSVFGYDAAADHAAIVSEGRGRRVFPAAPAHSLFLRKATADMPHGGGLK
ncbi:MAG: hypothetical protein RLZZ458_908, partial [Planctomycetota bacterium]